MRTAKIREAFANTDVTSHAQMMVGFSHSTSAFLILARPGKTLRTTGNKDEPTLSMSKRSMSLQAAMCHSIGGGSFSNVISGAKLSLFVV